MSSTSNVAPSDNKQPVAVPAGNMNPTPSAPSLSQIPDLMKIGAIKDNVAQDVETDVLEPVVASEKFIRFQLQNKGILHSHSKVQFKLECADQHFLPMNVGIASLIQRATLKVGNKTICEVDDFNHFTSYRSMFMDASAMKERLPYQTGQGISHEFCYTDESTTATGGGGSNYEAKGIGLDDDMSYAVINRAGGMDYSTAVPKKSLQQFSQLDNRWTSKAPSTWQFSISDLFPFLKINQLPLYMMREAIQLEFVLSSQIGERSICEAGAEPLTNVTIDSTETRLILDYIYYPQEMMVAYANANRSLRFNYVDYRLSKHTFDPASSSGVQIRNLGGAGRIVNKIVWGMSNNDETADSLLNKYSSWSAERDYAGTYTSDTNGKLTANIKYNDNFLYPIDVDNTARHFHNVVQAEQLVPYVSREEYGNEGQSLTSRTLLGRAQNTDLAGQFFWTAGKLLTGERINSRGIELYYNYATLPTATLYYTQRAWLEILRYATIEDGITNCYYA